MPRAVRRPRAAAGVAGVLVLGLSVVLSGCAGIGQPAPYDSAGINGLIIPTPSPDPDDFAAGVDNPWLPLEEGARWSYEVTDEEGRALGTIDVEVEPTTTTIAGLVSTGVVTSSDLGGGTALETRYYAQDDDGNVWLVGADSVDAGWRAGEDGAQAGLAMPADPRLGDGWLAHAVPGLPEARTTVEDQSRQMVQTLEAGHSLSGDHETDAETRNVYESGVGLVSAEDLTAGWVARRVDGPATA